MKRTIIAAALAFSFNTLLAWDLSAGSAAAGQLPDNIEKRCMSQRQVIQDANEGGAQSIRVFERDDAIKFLAIAIIATHADPAKFAVPETAVAVTWDSETEVVFFKSGCSIAVLHTGPEAFNAIVGKMASMKSSI